MYDETDTSAEPMSGVDARLSTLFHESTADVTPDVATLVQGGIVRGRGKRRTRNVGASLAVAAVVAGGIGLAVNIAPSGGARGTSFQPAGSSGPVASLPPDTPKVIPTKKAAPPSKPAHAGIPVKAADLPQLFTKLYPGKITPAEERTGRIIDNGKESQYAHFLWNGFTTSVGFATYDGTPTERCTLLRQAEQARGTAGVRITCTPRPDGSVLLSWRSPQAGGMAAQSVSLLTVHGYEIAVISYNTATKSGPALAAKPPFTMDQLTQAVTSNIWFK